mmetsp:Transcript_22049/g.71661  ORF Transcript_22049/g.71661 Transcript_22049/m.71661 type:complete len:232 (-) Transcript_22049:1261-1956(-)
MRREMWSLAAHPKPSAQLYGTLGREPRRPGMASPRRGGAAHARSGRSLAQNVSPHSNPPGGADADSSCAAAAGGAGTGCGGGGGAAAAAGAAAAGASSVLSAAAASSSGEAPRMSSGVSSASPGSTSLMVAFACSQPRRSALNKSHSCLELRAAPACSQSSTISRSICASIRGRASDSLNFSPRCIACACMLTSSSSTASRETLRPCWRATSLREKSALTWIADIGAVIFR